VVYDPCNPVPNNTIPSGLPLHPHHVAHRVVGRIKHSIHHKFVHLGPPAGAPNPYGCEKHAIAGPGYGHGAPAAAPAIAPASKLAALGGAGAGLVALGGVGGLIGGIFPGPPTSTRSKIAFAGPGTTPVSLNPVPVVPVPPSTPNPPTIIVPPIVPTGPGSPPTQVPEPSTLAIFLFAAAVAMAVRHVHRLRPQRSSVSSA
jgi:hypothetical protein